MHAALPPRTHRLAIHQAYIHTYRVVIPYYCAQEEAAAHPPKAVEEKSAEAQVANKGANSRGLVWSFIHAFRFPNKGACEECSTVL